MACTLETLHVLILRQGRRVTAVRVLVVGVLQLARAEEVGPREDALVALLVAAEAEAVEEVVVGAAEVVVVGEEVVVGVDEE